MPTLALAVVRNLELGGGVTCCGVKGEFAALAGFFQKEKKKQTKNPTKRNDAAPLGAELAAPEGKILMR